jgi:threonine dehydrogenase-like Zn-dependent dehydrogenase
VIGHELVARDGDGRRCVVEMNDSPAAREAAGDCPDCAAGLARHCPKRLVLGIHDLPGGFGPQVLAPSGAVLPVPDELPDDTAVLVEPFAAALRAVERTPPRAGDRIAVLGPRRLGLLVVAALDGVRRRDGIDCELVAVVRREALGEAAREVGADAVAVVAGDHGAGLADGSFDVVFDTTGSPSGLETALRLARREVHLKSTHGRPAGGLTDPTAFVVDELTLAAAPDEALAAATADDPAPALRLTAPLDALPLRDAIRRQRLGANPAACLGGAWQVEIPGLACADAAIRPSPHDAEGLVRPTGRLVLTGPDPVDTPLARAVLQRGITLSSSRCGDFRRALELLATDEQLRDLGRRMVTHRFGPDQLAAAFDAARAADCRKAVVVHPDLTS